MESSGRSDAEHEITTIQFLYIPDCPNSPEMKNSLMAAIAQSDRKFRLIEIDLMTLKPGDDRLGYGAPTVLVDGVDLFGAKSSKATSGTCRVYPGMLPTSKEIKASLLRLH